jgi:acyl-coenzyme A thioesterase PaaI-like protein
VTKLSDSGDCHCLRSCARTNLMALAVGDHLEAIGTVLKSGRTLTVCQLEVFAVQGVTRSLVAAGQQTLICVPERSER